MKGLKKEEGFGLSCLVLKEKQKKKVSNLNFLKKVRY